MIAYLIENGKGAYYCKTHCNGYVADAFLASKYLTKKTAKEELKRLKFSENWVVAEHELDDEYMLANYHKEMEDFEAKKREEKIIDEQCKTDERY